MMGAPAAFRCRRGITIAEAAIATIIVAGVLVAAMNSVAASRTIRGRVADRVRAQQLGARSDVGNLATGLCRSGDTRCVACRLGLCQRLQRAG